MKKITIWQMTGVMNAGGAESLIMELLRNKTEDVNMVLIVHSSNADYHGTYDEEINEMNVPIYCLPSVGSVGLRKYKKEFINLMSKIGTPDIIHSHINGTGGFISKIAKACGIPCRIVHCHADIKFRGSRLNVIKNELELFLMKIYVNRYANYFWACSKAAGDRLFYSKKTFTIIENVINVRRYLNSPEKRSRERKKIKQSNDAIIVGAVGRIARIKNYETIICAISELREQGKNTHFYCYGRVVDEAYYDELRELIKRHNLQEYIHFQGNCQNISDTIAAFDVFVMPSITEGLGISALEAQAAGLPTLLSTGVPDEANMGLGLVKKINPYQSVEWAKAIKQVETIILSNETIVEAFREKGYDSSTKCNEIYQLYKKMAIE